MDNQPITDVDQDSDLPAGFLIKDKSGQFKKVQDDGIVDFTVKKQIPAQPMPSRPAPSAPPARPVQPPMPPVRQVLPVKPPPPVSSSPTASNFMAPDDEMEIKEQQAKLDQILEAPAGNAVLSVEDIVAKVVNDFQLRFDDDVMQKRFAKVVESRLRDLRDSVETTEVLSRSKKIGGLEIPRPQAENMVKFLEKHISAKPVVSPAGHVPAPVVQADIPPAFIPRPQPPVPPPAPPVMEVKKLAEEIQREMTIRPVEPARQPPVPPPAPPVRQAEPPVSTPDLYSRPPDELPRIVQVRQIEPERPRVIDIKRPAKVMGPVEELGDIDLDEFRRQGTNPTEAADRIVEKIDLLEHDSWEMKIAGTKAWKRSPAHQLYVEIGRESMESGQTVAEAIRKRMQENRPYLLLDEFLAINSLNSRLII